MPLHCLWTGTNTPSLSIYITHVFSRSTNTPSPCLCSLHGQVLSHTLSICSMLLTITHISSHSYVLTIYCTVHGQVLTSPTHPLDMYLYVTTTNISSPATCLCTVYGQVPTHPLYRYTSLTYSLDLLTLPLHAFALSMARYYHTPSRSVVCY